LDTQPDNQRSERQQTLKGIRVLVGRARHQASDLSTKLRGLGAEVIEIPFIEIREPESFAKLDRALVEISRYDWLILTSVNGVNAMWERMGKLGLEGNSLEHLKVAAIGPATRKGIESRGLTVDIMPKEYVAESVVSSLRHLVEGKRTLLVRAKVARDVIPRELQNAGAQVDVVEAYETVIPEQSREALRQIFDQPENTPQFITFTSSSSVKNFATLVGQAGMQKIRSRHNLESGLRRPLLASIGPVTSATLRELKLPVDVEASEYTISGLVQAIVDKSHKVGS
jgi:uroporphyrinogen-III synthase